MSSEGGLVAEPRTGDPRIDVPRVTVAEAATAVAEASFLVAIVDTDQPDGSGSDVVDLLRAAGSGA